jgi:hypothetical protein
MPAMPVRHAMHDYNPIKTWPCWCSLHLCSCMFQQPAAKTLRHNPPKPWCIQITADHTVALATGDCCLPCPLRQHAVPRLLHQQPCQGLNVVYTASPTHMLRLLPHELLLATHAGTHHQQAGSDASRTHHMQASTKRHCLLATALPAFEPQLSSALHRPQQQGRHLSVLRTLGRRAYTLTHSTSSASSLKATPKPTSMSSARV